MHALFLVGGKLLGIYFIMNGLIEAFLLSNTSGTGPFANQLAVSCLIKLTGGTVLAFCTGIVAKGVRVSEQPADQCRASPFRSALMVGIVLLGLLQLTQLLPRAAMRLSEYPQMFARTRSPVDLLSVELLNAVAALLLVCFAGRIAGFLERMNRQPSAP